MDTQKESAEPTGGVNPDDTDAEAQRLLEANRKHGTSGLSWDEVAEKDKKGWRQVTDMGEGD